MEPPSIKLPFTALDMDSLLSPGFKVEEGLFTLRH